MRAEPRAGQGELGGAGLGLPAVCWTRPGVQTLPEQDPALLVLRGSRAAPAASSPSASIQSRMLSSREPPQAELSALPRRALFLLFSLPSSERRIWGLVQVLVLVFPKHGGR